jgi:hypothetical protein
MMTSLFFEPALDYMSRINNFTTEAPVKKKKDDFTIVFPNKEKGDFIAKVSKVYFRSADVKYYHNDVMLSVDSYSYRMSPEDKEGIRVKNMYSALERVYGKRAAHGKAVKYVRLIRARVNRLVLESLCMDSKERGLIYSITKKTRVSVKGKYVSILDLIPYLAANHRAFILSDLYKMPRAMAKYCMDSAYKARSNSHIDDYNEFDSGELNSRQKYVRSENMFKAHMDAIKTAPWGIKNKYGLDLQVGKPQYPPETRFQWYCWAAHNKRYCYGGAQLDEERAVCRANIKAWHMYKKWTHMEGPYTVRNLMAMLNFIDDANRIHGELGMPKIKGSLIKRVGDSITAHLHHREELMKSMLKGPDDPMVVSGLYKDALASGIVPVALEEQRIKTTHQMIMAGHECRYCMGTYVHHTDSVFFRKGMICAQVYTDDLRVNQCFDANDKVTPQSKKYKDWLYKQLGTIKKKLEREEMQGILPELPNPAPGAVEYDIATGHEVVEVDCTKLRGTEPNPATDELDKDAQELNEALNDLSYTMRKEQVIESIFEIPDKNDDFQDEDTDDPDGLSIVSEDEVFSDLDAPWGEGGGKS